MRATAEKLHLDLEFLARDLTFRRGIGMGYLARIEESGRTAWNSAAFAATCFRRAGAHSLLLDDLKLAQEMFARSAECYARLQRPYAAMMWCVARNLGSAERFSEDRLSEFEQREGRLSSEKYGQLTFSLLVDSVGLDQTKDYDVARKLDHRFRRVWAELGAFSTSSVGMIGIPIASYLRLATALRESEAPEPVLSSLLPFLNAYDLAFETARSKAFHWRRLLMPFHPAEPDILSVFSIADKWLNRRGKRAMDFVRERSDSPLAATLLAEGLEAIEDKFAG